MNLFHKDYSKPGPGVSPDEPRKKGIGRLYEIVGRDLTPLALAGSLALLGSLPFLLGIYHAMRERTLPYALLAGILGGALAAPTSCGLADTILRTLRDEPNYWWATYRRAWKANWKASLAPGAVFGLLFAADLFLFANLDASHTALLALLLLGLVLLCGAALYTTAQLVLLELPMRDILLNAALLTAKQPLRTLAAILILLGHCLLVWMYFPFTVLEMLLVGSWFPDLWALFLIYPALNRDLRIEESIRELNRQKYTDAQNKE